MDKSFLLLFFQWCYFTTVCLSDPAPILNVCTHMSMNVGIYLAMCVCVYSVLKIIMCMHVCTYTYIYIYIYMHMLIDIYIYMHIYDAGIFGVLRPSNIYVRTVTGF